MKYKSKKSRNTKGILRFIGLPDVSGDIGIVHNRKYNDMDYSDPKDSSIGYTESNWKDDIDCSMDKSFSQRRGFVEDKKRGYLQDVPEEIKFFDNKSDNDIDPYPIEY